MWVAILVLFRSLLRVSHVIDSPFMSEVGIPLGEIKNCGLWASPCILDYISPSVSQVCRNDAKIAFYSDCLWACSVQ